MHRRCYRYRRYRYPASTREVLRERTDDGAAGGWGEGRTATRSASIRGGGGLGSWCRDNNTRGARIPAGAPRIRARARARAPTLKSRAAPRPFVRSRVARINRPPVLPFPPPPPPPPPPPASPLPPNPPVARVQPLLRVFVTF